MGKFIAWLRGLFQAPAPTLRTADLGLFDPSQRLVYRYRTTTLRPDVPPEYVTADPMELWKRLMDVGPELNRNIKVSQSELKVAHAHHLLLVSQVRELFRVPEFADGGLTQLECVMLLNHFLAYVGVEKKNTPTSPTSSPPEGEGGVPDFAPSTDGPPTSQSSSDSGSTDSAPSTGQQQPSPSGSA